MERCNRTDSLALIRYTFGQLTPAWNGKRVVGNESPSLTRRLA